MSMSCNADGAAALVGYTRSQDVPTCFNRLNAGKWRSAASMYCEGIPPCKLSMMRCVASLVMHAALGYRHVFKKKKQFKKRGHVSCTVLARRTLSQAASRRRRLHTHHVARITVSHLSAIALTCALVRLHSVRGRVTTLCDNRTEPNGRTSIHPHVWCHVDTTSLAQLVERRTFNPVVRGSSPLRGTYGWRAAESPPPFVFGTVTAACIASKVHFNTC